MEYHIPGYDQPLVYDSAERHYYHGDRRMWGATRLTKLLSNPFNADYRSRKKAVKEGVTAEEIRARWDAKRDAASELGTRVHHFAEQLAYEPIDGSESKNARLIVNPRTSEYPKPSGTQVWHEAGVIEAYDQLKIVPLAAEKVICDPAISVVGVVDLICRLSINRDLAILDWKTNEKLDLYNRFGDKMLPPLDHLDDCKFSHYALQLNLYRDILQRIYQLPCERMVIIWLTGDGSFQMIEVPIMQAETWMMISAWQNRKTKQ